MGTVLYGTAHMRSSGCPARVRLDRKTTAVLLAAGVSLTAAAAAVLTSAQSAPAQVSAYPLPGTVTASTTTQISLRGVKPDALGTIAVSGSRSGPHSGRLSLRAHSDGNGASWLPDLRFQAGETVTVRTSLVVRGARDGDFRFRVARIPGRVTIPTVVLEDIDAGRTRRFRSRPDLAPPVVTVDPGPRQTSPGYVFLSPKSKKDRSRPGR